MSKPSLKEENPRFRNKDTRVRVALSRYYGMGDEEPKTMEEIADYLRVSKKTVNQYINHTEMGEQAEEMLADAQARTRMEIAMKLLNHLDRLDNMIDEKLEEKEPAVVSHRYESAMGEVSMNRDGMHLTDEKEIEFEVPVPDKFKEMVKVDDGLKTLMRERRMVVEQIEDLMGLEAPDKIESEHEETIRDIKIFEAPSLDEAEYPEAEVIDISNKEEDD